MPPHPSSMQILWPLLPITTIASLSTTQKHFDWAALLPLGVLLCLMPDVFTRELGRPRAFEVSVG